MMVLLWLLLSRVISTDLFVAVLIENFEIAETVRLIAEVQPIAVMSSNHIVRVLHVHHQYIDRTKLLSLVRSQPCLHALGTI